MFNYLITGIGWLGVLLCTLAYLLLSLKVIASESRIFQLLNILGGLCLTAVAIETRDLPNAAANILWMLIGLFALFSHLRSKKGSAGAKDVG